MKIGLIAEDRSDVDILRGVTAKLLGRSRVGFKFFVGQGSGKLRRKCCAWARILVEQGCPWIAVAHDLDAYDETSLRAELGGAISASGARVSVVLIPRREIEAWLLYDGEAIARAFGVRSVPRLPGDPEALADPKGFMRDLVRRRYGKQYLHTVHNRLIAEQINVSRLAGSRSFAPHPKFVRAVQQDSR